MGPSGGVSTGHPLTTAAAFGILLKGGNAFDAGVASLLAGGVLEQDLYSLGGEALVLVYPKKEDKVTSIVGQGWAPNAVDVDWYLSRKKTLHGEGLDPAVVPGRAACRAHRAREVGHDELRRGGGAGDWLRRARLPDAQQHGARDPAQLKFFERWPGNKKYWLKPDGSLYKPGETIKLPALARTLRRMVDAERAAKSKGRGAGIVAARDRFYKGDIAREMVAFLRKHDAPFDESDFAEYFARIEEPAQDDLSRLHRLQARLRQPGSGAAADAQHPRAVRSPRDGLCERGLPPHGRRSDEARLRGPRFVLRGSRRS